MELSYLAHSPTAAQWNKIAIKHHHGIALPLFSLHSSQSTGIGEFTDLIPFIDWCVSVGFDLIQLLPINDTGLGTSPYSALTAFALNPIYIGLNDLPFLHDHTILQEQLKAIPKFSYSTIVDYTLVREHKMRFLLHYYEITKNQIIESEAFKEFAREASTWLTGYAVFKILKKKHSEIDWECWTEEEKHPTSELLIRIERENIDEFNFQRVLQFLCDTQMKEAKNYANHHHVLLMGDIPILIDRGSADVWLHRELFDLNFSAGAPPDMFSYEGQNWGFPVYNWEGLARQDYHWWKERLRWATRYYHLYRIDHIVGFFRIWTIPYQMTGKDGFFVPHDAATWIDHGQRLMLMMISATEMLPIGEDLGVIPPEVRTCLNTLGICGTKVMRWERKWEEDRRFIPPEDYLLASMTTVGTHDSETLQQWWQLNPEEAQNYASFKGWCYQPVLSREHHREILWDSHHTASLFHVNPLQEYLALVPGFTWQNLEDERINVPGIVSDRNWTYRIKPTLEELSLNATLKHIIQELIK